MRIWSNFTVDSPFQAPARWCGTFAYIDLGQRVRHACRFPVLLRVDRLAYRSVSLQVRRPRSATTRAHSRWPTTPRTTSVLFLALLLALPALPVRFALCLLSARRFEEQGEARRGAGWRREGGQGDRQGEGKGPSTGEEPQVISNPWPINHQQEKKTRPRQKEATCARPEQNKGGSHPNKRGTTPSPHKSRRNESTVHSS